MGLWDGLLFQAKLDEESGTRVDNIGGRNMPVVGGTPGRIAALQQYGILIPVASVQDSGVLWSDAGNPLALGSAWTIGVWLYIGDEIPDRPSGSNLIVPLTDDAGHHPVIEFHYDYVSVNYEIILFGDAAHHTLLDPMFGTGFHQVIAWFDGSDYRYSADNGGATVFNPGSWSGILTQIGVQDHYRTSVQDLSVGADNLCIWGRVLSSDERGDFYAYYEPIGPPGPGPGGGVGSFFPVMNRIIARRRRRRA